MTLYCLFLLLCLIYFLMAVPTGLGCGSLEFGCVLTYNVIKGIHLSGIREAAAWWSKDSPVEHGVLETGGD